MEAVVETSARVPQRALRKAGANVNRAERVLSALGGGAMLALGLKRRGAQGLLLAIAGSALFRRATTGQSRVYRSLGLTSLEQPPLLGRRGDEGREAALERGVRRVERSITIGRAREEIFAALTDPERLRIVLGGIAPVERIGGNGARWADPVADEGEASQQEQAMLSEGGSEEQGSTQPEVRRAFWDGELAEVRDGERIVWRAAREEAGILGCEIALAPAPGMRGTEVRVLLEHRPPGGGVGLGLMKLAGVDPDQRVRTALRRLKQIVEVGEIATTEGQTSCRRSNGA